MEKANKWNRLLCTNKQHFTFTTCKRKLQQVQGKQKKHINIKNRNKEEKGKEPTILVQGALLWDKISIHTLDIFACCVAFFSVTKHIYTKRRIFPFPSMQLRDERAISEEKENTTVACPSFCL